MHEDSEGIEPRGGAQTRTGQSKEHNVNEWLYREEPLQLPSSMELKEDTSDHPCFLKACRNVFREAIVPWCVSRLMSRCN